MRGEVDGSVDDIIDVKVSDGAADISKREPVRVVVGLSSVEFAVSNK